MPNFENAVLDLAVHTAARSSGFRPFLRSDANTKSAGSGYKLRTRHSGTAFFSAACMGRGFADPSVFVSLRCPPRPQVVGVPDVKDSACEVEFNRREEEASCNMGLPMVGK